jgi:hypothetical protein
MKFLITLLFLAGCTLSAYPVDYMGTGAYCQPLSEYRQRCWDRQQKPWICYVQGAGWRCHREYPPTWRY